MLKSLADIKKNIKDLYEVFETNTTLKSNPDTNTSSSNNSLYKYELNINNMDLIIAASPLSIKSEKK